MLNRPEYDRYVSWWRAVRELYYRLRRNEQYLFDELEITVHLFEQMNLFLKKNLSSDVDLDLLDKFINNDYVRYREYLLENRSSIREFISSRPSVEDFVDNIMEQKAGVLGIEFDAYIQNVLNMDEAISNVIGVISVLSAAEELRLADSEASSVSELSEIEGNVVKKRAGSSLSRKSYRENTKNPFLIVEQYRNCLGASDLIKNSLLCNLILAIEILDRIVTSLSRFTSFVRVKK